MIDTAFLDRRLNIEEDPMKEIEDADRSMDVEMVPTTTTTATTTTTTIPRRHQVLSQHYSVLAYAPLECHYGGIYMGSKYGCICGKGTKGFRCEELLVDEREIKEMTMCGPGCWASYVWYDTPYFTFKSIYGYEQSDNIVARVEQFLAWQDGGEWRYHNFDLEKEKAEREKTETVEGQGGGIDNNDDDENLESGFGSPYRLLPKIKFSDLRDGKKVIDHHGVPLYDDFSLFPSSVDTLPSSMDTVDNGETKEEKEVEEGGISGDHQEIGGGDEMSMEMGTKEIFKGFRRASSKNEEEEEDDDVSAETKAKWATYQEELDYSLSTTNAMETRIDREILENLGPWTDVDLQMLRLMDEFNSYQPRITNTFYKIFNPHTKKNLTPKKKATNVYGIICHQNVAQFDAFWRIMFSPDHYYIVHVDKNSGIEITDQIYNIINNFEYEEREETTDIAKRKRKTGIDLSVSAKDTPTNIFPENTREKKNSEDVSLTKSEILKSSARDYSKKIWERVVLLDEEVTFASMWGDVTLVYLEYLMWLVAMLKVTLHQWRFDYFINLSIADIPLADHKYISKYMGAKIPVNHYHSHENKGEFRQISIVPERWDQDTVVTLNITQQSMPSGRWRAKYAQDRIHGCTQWHMYHASLIHEFTTNQKLYGLLFSLKDTGIPDESFFSTAVKWMEKTSKAEKWPIIFQQGGPDSRYRNEGYNRDLRHEGEFELLGELKRKKDFLFARKAYTSIVTCNYTNLIMELENDCSRYEKFEEAYSLEHSAKEKKRERKKKDRQAREREAQRKLEQKKKSS